MSCSHIRSEDFKLSNDPLFVEKVYDIVGLYLNPPQAAVVLCVDEKSQIQALARSQPALPMMPGMPEKRTHDYVRSGTTSLFAAFDISDGTVITALHRRHRAIEFRKFLATIDAQVPDHLDVHLVCDNYGTHKTPTVQSWLANHPRVHMHYTPTYSSWINQVERWFAELTRQLIERGDHRSVQALERDIRAWVAAWNDKPIPFVWTKTAEQILQSIQRLMKRINGAGHYDAVGGVGEKPGDAVPVGVGEPQLGAGMRAFLTQDQPGAGRPGGQVHQGGGLTDPGAVADAAVGLDRRIPVAVGEYLGGIAHGGVDRTAQREPHVCVAARRGETIGGARGVRADQHLRGLRVIGVGPVGRRQRLQCLTQHGDVIGGGVAAGIART